MDNKSPQNGPPATGGPGPAGDRRMTQEPGAKGANESRATRGKPLRAILIAGILVLAALVATWEWYQGTRRYVSTDDANIEAHRLTVSSKMLGRIDSLGTDEGDTISAGQLLVRLNTSDLLAQRAQAESGLMVAQANARLARVTLDRAQTDWERARRLFETQTMTPEQYDHAKNEYEAAQARLAVAEAQIRSTQAQISVIDTSLSNAIIRSPLHGVVSKRWVLVGDVVQPSQAIFSVYDLDSVWVTANLEETKLGRVQPGDSVLIHVDTYPDRKFAGRVVEIGANTAAEFSLIPPNNASGNFTKVTQRVPVKISIMPVDDSPRVTPLLPGMSVEVKVKVRLT
jgi:membrane fusion protein (multidrug efflux system)